MIANDSFDYNLIKTLILVFETKSMGGAAKALGVSAPTLSYSLNKIRKYYNDPLFVKTAHGIKVTPVAKELYPLFKRLDEEFQRAIVLNDAGNYSVRNVIIRTNTVIELFLMGHVMGIDGEEGELNFSFNNKALTDEQRIGALISRESDIDIGPMIRAENSLICTHLFKSKLAALCSINHPRMGHATNEDQWLKEGHAIMSIVEGGSHWSSEVNELLVQRKIRYRTMSLVNIFHYLESSESIMIIPEYFMRFIIGRFALKSVEIASFNNTLLDIYAYTHSRAKEDEKLKMIIDLLKEN